MFFDVGAFFIEPCDSLIIYLGALFQELRIPRATFQELRIPRAIFQELRDGGRGMKL